MITIWFEDIAWTNGNNETIPMNYGNEIITNARLLYSYKPPIITEDTWNGKSIPVQIINNEGYSIQFTQRELSIHQIAKLQSSKKVYVHCHETNEIIEVDTTQPGQMTLEPLGRLGTAHQGYIFTFTNKKKRAVVNHGIARLQTYNLNITFESANYNYYTDFDVIKSSTDTEVLSYESSLDGHLEPTKFTQKETYKMLFYLLEADMILLKKHVENALPSDVLINALYTPIEAGKCKVDLIAEKLYKCECEFVTNSRLDYA